MVSFRDVPRIFFGGLRGAYIFSSGIELHRIQRAQKIFLKCVCPWDMTDKRGEEYLIIKKD